MPQLEDRLALLLDRAHPELLVCCCSYQPPYCCHHWDVFRRNIFLT
ncbi:hypothetical protein [Streptomyces sp. NPDC004008]